METASASPPAIRENVESFLSLSLDVKNLGSMEESLKRFVSGETISDFLWNEGEPRVDIVKRPCINELSDSVVFHLSRFELNYDTFLREKLNDRFAFPDFLDLFPYSKAGLAAAAAGAAAADRDQESRDYYCFGIACCSAAYILLSLI